jgi:hypothetical protein
MNAQWGGESLGFASPANADVTQQLLHSTEPSLRLQVVSDLMGHRPDSRDVRQLAEHVRTSSRVAMLLSERDYGTHPAPSIHGQVVRGTLGAGRPRRTALPTGR